MTEQELRALDAQVAEKVMGQVPCAAWYGSNLGSAGGPVVINEGCEHAPDGCYPADETIPFGGPRHYSSDIAAAFTVVEKMNGRGLQFRAQQNYAFRWFVAFINAAYPVTDSKSWDAAADKLPEAICLAALQAVEAER